MNTMLRDNAWKKIVFSAVVLLIMFIPVSGISAEAEEDWMTNEEMIERLNDIEEASDGKVELGTLGQSSQGTDIPMARVGTGDQVAIINGQIHGNEFSGPEAIISMLEKLADDSSFSQHIRDEVTIVFIPRFNMDGAVLTQRQNVFPWEQVVETYPHLEGADSAWYYNSRAEGFDINRDFNADLDYEVQAEDLPGNTLLPGFFLTSESQALRDLYIELRDEFGHVELFVDVHHMGTPDMNKTGEPVTIAIDFPPLGPEDSGKYDDWPLLDQDKSKRYSLAAALGVKELSDEEESGVAQYIHFQERDYPGQARSALALNGTATVLFEMPGQQPAYGYDQELIDRVENGLWGMITRAADGTIDDLNGDDFLTEIPRYWTDNITDMRDVVTGRFTEEGQFENARDARLLDNHLAALEIYEQEEDAEKMVKHLNGFKDLIDHQRENGSIERAAYSRLNSDTNLLLERWENKLYSNVSFSVERWQNNLID
ncbi:M14 family zinc carboxypeptidase [Virgibacillus sp. YIM 98842]|uniref:M14 family zinc carboxypeptidase n=1 Tax=Virgibacillus sp. YIM 98842 TaxID=2663533 RepID=UPI0013D94226|nr:M14 family zinc carboxypeptidase [Virgibacillus sp. YIM 98842]